MMNVNKKHFQIKKYKWKKKKRHLKLWMSQATDRSRLDPPAHKTSVKHIYSLTPLDNKSQGFGVEGSNLQC